MFIQFFLPKRQAWSKKFYLDRHQDDFRPGARAGYYLLVPEIARLSDLGSDQATMKIGLDGQDDWELTSFSLEINDKVTLLRGQGHWLRDGGNSVYVTSYRDSGYDRKQRHRGVTLPKLVDLRPRLEAMIGNQLNQPLETRDTRGSWNTHIPANEALRLTKVGDYRTRAAVFVVGRYRGEEAVRFELDFDLVIEHPRVGAPTLNVQDFRVRETWSAVSGAVRSFLNSSGYQLLRSFVDLASYPFGGAHPGTDRRVDIDGELERTRRTIEASAGLDAFKLSFDPKLDFDADLVVTEVRSRYPQIPEAMIRDFLVKEGFPSGGTYPRHLRFQDDASISVFEWPRAIDRIVSLVYNEYVPVAIPMGRAGR